MRYLFQPKDRIYVKGYGFLSFAKNMDTHLSNKYCQKLLDTAKKSATDSTKTTSKRAIPKAAEATSDLIGNKTAHKITTIPKNSSRALHSVELRSQNNEANDELEVPKKRHVSSEK